MLPEAKQSGSELVSAPALWIQKMWHKLFPLLCEPLLHKSAGDALEGEMNALLATCNFLMGVPYVVISSDPQQLPIVLRIVVWALDVSVKQPESESSAKLREAALTTLEQLSKQQPELLITHLSTIIPHLLETSRGSKPTSVSFSAVDRARSCRILLMIAALPYDALHPHKKSVIKGLATPCDDPKQAIRRLAVKARNEWSVLASA